MPRLSLDPRARVLLLALACVPPACFNDPAWTGAVTASVVGFSLLGGGAKALRRAAPFLLALVSASALLWALLLGTGEPLVSLGPLVLRGTSLQFGLAMGLRLAAWSAAGLAFVAVTPVEEMTWALNRLGLPYPAAFGLSMSVRLAEQFTEAGRQVARAQEVRGLDLRSGSWPTRLARSAPILVPMLVLALRRVNRMAMAMEARGYGAGPRSSWIEGRWTTRESLAVGSSLVAAALCVALRLQGLGVVLPGRL